MSLTANGPSFGKRFGVALLLGMPGIVALVGYIYFTTPATAVPAGLSLPLLALVSAVNPLLLLGVACLLGALDITSADTIADICTLCCLR